MIEKALSNWREFLKGNLEAGDIVADDCTFISPVVFKPLHGRAITEKYLSAAHRALAGHPGADRKTSDANGSFRYVREVIAEPHAVLEFEVTLDGILINGVDMITADDEGRIVEFKVMVRPLQGVNKIHQIMGEQLRKL